MIANSFLSFFLVGAGGAVSVELLKFWEYRGKLDRRKFDRLIRSPMFWSAVAGFIASSGFLTWALFAEQASVRAAELVVTGAGCRSIIRELLAAKVASTPPVLGEEPDKVSARDILL